MVFTSDLAATKHATSSIVSQKSIFMTIALVACTMLASVLTGVTTRSSDKIFLTPPGTVRVSIYGDSITAGCCCKGESGGMTGYVDLLKKFFDESQVQGESNYAVHVLASSGRTVTIGGNPKCYTKMSHGYDGGDKHFSVWGPKAIRGAAEVSHQIEAFKAAAKEEAPDVVLIMLGTNDAYADWGLCEESFVRDMTALIRIHQNLASKPRIVLINPPMYHQCNHDVRDDSTTPYKDAKCAEAGLAANDPEVEVKCIVKCVIPTLLRRIAIHVGIEPPLDLSTVIDETTMQPKPKGGYDIHPTCTGHEQISELLKTQVFPPAKAKVDSLRVAQKIQFNEVGTKP
eukprot:SAG31_NODE_169_length_21415_cov_29.765338_10_plen_343_part_00